MRVIILFLALCGRISAAGVGFAWDLNTEPDIAGYKLRYSQVSANLENPSAGGVTTFDAGNVNSLSVKGLAAGVVYYFAVYAYNTEGLESLPSNIVSHVASNSQKYIFTHELKTLPSGNISFSITSPQNKLFNILSSYDLQIWDILESIASTTGNIVFEDEDSNLFTRRFYKIEYSIE